uniref:Uncharacterized protein n=1 Tax=Avena sativa TaxID=4498 RepID=A0ACD6AKE2_AVESA
MTATEVAALLDLKPHPEGGYYAETFRDSSVSLTTDQLPPQCIFICLVVLSSGLELSANAISFENDDLMYSSTVCGGMRRLDQIQSGFHVPSLFNLACPE